MKKNITKEIESKMLSPEQENAVKKMIVKSMRESYINIGTLPDLGFENAAAKIAEGVVHDVQMVLMESNVFKNIVSSTKPLKVIRKKKNARK